CATKVGRYLVTMMSTGVILATGFQLSGGNNQLDTLIWYSWLGGIIIGTMIGSNMVLEEHYKAGPRNIVITGRKIRWLFHGPRFTTVYNERSWSKHREKQRWFLLAQALHFMLELARGSCSSTWSSSTIWKPNHVG
ncbi:hypothetical protein IFM89_036682, partial [Coptis chinensis]